MTEARITVTQRRQRTLGERVFDALGVTPTHRDDRDDRDWINIVRSTPTHRDDRKIVESASINNEVGGKDNSWYRVDAEGRSGGDVAIHFHHDPQDQDGDVKVKGKLFLTGKNGGYVELAESAVTDGEIVIFKLGDTKETEIEVAHGIKENTNPRSSTSSAFYNLPRIMLKR